MRLGAAEVGVDALQSPLMAVEYKVMTQKDKAWGDRFDPQQLEDAINAYASEGWRIVTMASASLGGDRDEVVIVFGREV